MLRSLVLFVTVSLLSQALGIEKVLFNKSCDDIILAIAKKDITTLQKYFASRILFTAIEAEDEYNEKSDFDGFLRARGEVYDTFFSTSRMPRHPFRSIHDMLRNQRKIARIYEPVEDADLVNQRLISGYAIIIYSESPRKDPGIVSKAKLTLYLKCGQRSCKISGFFVDSWVD